MTCLAQQFPFVYYTPRDGLVNSRVRSIRQDSRGQMYFMTYGGLSVYDGVAFRNYRIADGLATELVNDIVEISPDSFLVATNAGALNTLVNGKIGTHITSDKFYPVINRFLKSTDGNLYFVADEGLFVLVDNKFKRLPLLDKAGVEIGINLNQVTEWGQYLLFVPWNFPQREKLIIYDKEHQVVAGTITEVAITSSAVTAKDELWLSSSDGILSMDKTSLLNGIIALHPKTDVRLKTWISAHIYVDHNRNTWIYRNDGILFISSSGEQQMLSADQGLKTKNLADLFVDREGNTWMASDGNGVVKMPGNNIQVLGDLVPGTSNVITAIHQKSDTTWLFNDADKSIYRIHNHQLTSFPLDLDSLAVNNIYVNGETLYYSTYQNIYRIANKNHSASYRHPVKLGLDIPDFLAFNRGLIDPNGVIIQTIWSQDKTNYLVVLKDDKVLIHDKLSYAIDQFALYKDQYLWIPTRDNHLRCYSLHPESPLQYLRLQHDYAKEMEGLEPRSIAVDTAGKVWIGTRAKGIYRLDFEEQGFQSALQFTTAQGLSDNFPLYLYCDSQNDIWAGSWTGLDKIAFQNGEFTIENITKNKNIFLGISKILNITDDVIWALTSTGDVIQISSGTQNNIAVTPTLFITSLAVNDQAFDDDVHEFNHDLNNLALSVAAPSFVDEKSILYSYWLEGGGKSNWSQPSNNANFNFINLSPGYYTLHLKAEFPAGIYPDQEVKYAFTIRPPYWKTWWFLSLISLCAIIFLGLIVRLYYSRKFDKQSAILEKKRAVEKERTRIATDMHDDLGAGLSRIKFLSETIGIKRQRHQPIEEEINNIRHYAHEMIDKMGEIVWALNEKNDSLSDLLSYTRAYAVEYLGENGLQCKIDKLPHFQTTLVNSEFRRNIYLSVKEVLHNVIKHARANSVSMHFHVNDKLVVIIKDDGIGFDPEHTNQFGNGLHNIRRRMSEIDGDFQISNDHGTRVMLTATIPS